MNPAQVDGLLASYKENEARCKFLECEIAHLNNLIDDLKNHFIEDNVSVTSKLTGMPHASGISNPTERIGMMAAEIDCDGYTPKYIEELEREVRDKQNELKYRTPSVVFVDSWLLVLQAKERFVVEGKVIEGMFWRDVIAQFNEKFGETYTRQRLKIICKKAIEKIYKVAQ